MEWPEGVRIKRYFVLRIDRPKHTYRLKQGASERKRFKDPRRGGKDHISQYSKLLKTSLLTDLLIHLMNSV